MPIVPAGPKPSVKDEPDKVEPAKIEAAPVLAHVSTSGQADIQHLAAERMIAESSGDDALIAAADARLAALGFKV